MKKNLEILEIEPKLTKDEKKYWRIKTSEGWMSCFDSIASGKLKDFIGKTACVEVAQSGDFQNIKKCYGEEDYSTKGEVRDEKPEVVRPGDHSNFQEDTYNKPKNNHATMYTSYAKDIFCALTQTSGSPEEITAEALMDKAIKLVKQAKEAFE